MKALIFKDNELSIEKYSLSKEYSKHGFYIKIIASGICGTDLHLMNKKSSNVSKVLGHEFYGQVTRIVDGTQIKSLNGEISVGDKVTVIPGTICNECAYCKGLPEHKNYCTHRNVFGSNLIIDDIDFVVGGNMDEVFVPSNYVVYKVNSNWPIGLGTLLEPVSVSVKAVKTSLKYAYNVKERELFAMVVGIGTIGFFICIALRKRGINVIAIDNNESRRNRAKENGIKYVFSDSFLQQDKYRDFINENMKGIEPDIVFEAVGQTETFTKCLELVRKGGVVLEVGNFVNIGTTSISPSVICNKEIVVVGSVLADENSYFEAEEILHTFVNTPKEVITNYTVDEYSKAFYMANKRSKVLKCNLVFR